MIFCTIKKCTFAAKDIAFLDHILNNSKHVPDDEKILVIRQLRKPTAKEVKSALGFYRSYIPNYEKLAH